MSLTYTSSAAIIPYHFDEKFLYLALSASALGYTIGMAVIPIAAEYLFTKYGFSTTILLFVPFLSLNVLSGFTYVQRTDSAPDGKHIGEDRGDNAEISATNSDSQQGVQQRLTRVLTNAKVFLKFY